LRVRAERWQQDLFGRDCGTGSRRSGRAGRVVGFV